MLLGSLTVGPGLSLGCRRHHGRREAETWSKGCISVVYYTGAADGNG